MTTPPAATELHAHEWWVWPGVGDAPAEPYGLRLDHHGPIAFAPEPPRVLMTPDSDPARHGPYNFKKRPAFYLQQPGAEPFAVFRLAPDTEDRAWGLFYHLASETLCEDGRIILRDGFTIFLNPYAPGTLVRYAYVGIGLDAATGERLYVRQGEHRDVAHLLTPELRTQVDAHEARMWAWYQDLRVRQAAGADLPNWSRRGP
jgi:hypothetical protein